MAFGGGGNKTQSQPAISSMKIQEKGYGTVVKIVYGLNRLTPVLGWYGDFYSKEQSNGSGGGKGGGGGGGSSSYVYYASIIFFLCEGLIRGYSGRYWRDKTINYQLSGYSFLTDGTSTQTPWGYLTTKHPDQALNYRYTALVAANDYLLSDGATLGNHTFEIFGKCVSNNEAHQNYWDAHIKDVISDFLTAPRYGAIDSNTASITLDLDAMHAYCVARHLLISPVIESQKPAHEYLSEWATVANAAIVWSEGKLKFIPYADQAYTGAFGSYTPVTTNRFDFNDDNVEEAIRPEIKKLIDCPNKVTVECINRAGDYNKYVAEHKDAAAIAQYGERPADVLNFDSICLTAVAKIVACTELSKQLYIRRAYTLKTFCSIVGAANNPDLLEPLDFVTVTDPALGLDNERCRIVSIEDNQEGNMTIVVEEAPEGVYCG